MNEQMYYVTVRKKVTVEGKVPVSADSLASAVELGEDHARQNDHRIVWDQVGAAHFRAIAVEEDS